MHRPVFLLLPLLLTAILPRSAVAQAIDAYGYDAAGQYHTDNYGSLPNLNLNTNVDVSDLKAKLEKDFAPLSRPAPQPWYNDSDYSPPSYTPPAPEKSHAQVFMEDMQRKADTGDKDALAFMGRDALYFQTDYPKAAELLQKASDAGERSSTFLLYHLLLDKNKGVQDIDRAAKLLPLVGGGYDAQINEAYGRALIAGDRVPKDVKAGLAMREKAADASYGDGTCPYTLAVDYETGNGIPQNWERAIHWYEAALWHEGSTYHTPEIAAKLGVLMLAQKDGLRTYRDDLAKLIADPLFPSPLSDADKAGFTAKIAAVVAAEGKPSQNPATVMGQLLMDPRFGTPNYGGAMRLFMDNPDPVAERELGRMYENGWWTERDHGQALKLFHKAADGNDGPAYYYLALDALHQWQAEKQAHGDSAHAASLQYDAEAAAEQGARNGDARAKSLHAQWTQYAAEHSLALTAEERDREYRAAHALWQEASDAGVAQATYCLGVTAEKGQGMPKDLPGAVKLFRQAADAGYPAAQEKLAILMLTGQDGLTKDVPGGRALLEKAAPSLPSAADELAVSLWHGPDGAAHGAEIQKWLQQAFDAGYWVAGRNLAKFWHVGLGGTKDEAQARACLDKAAAMGGREAAKVAAEAYAKGDAVTADPVAAAKWKAVAEQ